MTLLWYKAWLETRSRFIASVVGISLLCGFAVFCDFRNAVWASPASRVRACNAALFAAHTALCVLWVCAVSFLTMGGLLRESGADISAFTLALPVSRPRLMYVRVGMGLLQSAALGIIPWASMWFAARFAGGSPPMILVGYYVALLLCSGTFFFAIALLLSSTIRGTYTAPLLSLLISAGIFVVFSPDILRQWNPWLLITGLSLLNSNTAAPSGPLPWLHLSVTTLVSAVMVWLSVLAIKLRDL